MFSIRVQTRIWTAVQDDGPDGGRGAATWTRAEVSIGAAG